MKSIVRAQKVMPEKKELARNLRKEMTPAEEKIWHLIRNGQVNGRKFRRQQVIDGFVVDFFCSELKLIIEIDGDIHAFKKEYDSAREEHLRTQGFAVVRFTNNQIFEELETVKNALHEVTK